LVLNSALKKDTVKRLPQVLEQADPIPWLEEELQVKSKTGQELVKVSLTCTDADAAVALVQGVVDAYKENVIEKQKRLRERRVAELEKSYNSAHAKLGENKDALKESAETSGGGDPLQLNQKLMMAQLAFAESKRLHSEARTKLLEAQGRLDGYKTRAKLLGKLGVSQADLNAALKDDDVAALHRKRVVYYQHVIHDYQQDSNNPNEPGLIKARRGLKAARAKLSARRATVRKQLLARLRKAAKEEYGVNLEQLQSAVGPLRKQVTALAAQVKQQAEEVAKIGATTTEMELLRSDINQQEQFVAGLGNKLQTLQVEMKAADRVTVFQEADLEKVNSKRRIMATILAPFAALGLVCFGVGWWEFRARKIQSADEVATGLGMRVVGAVPALPGPALGRLIGTGETEDEFENSMLESIDGIRTLLLRDANLEATRVIMVTSAVGGEGKTTLASNLATSLARAGRKTLFIDCDLRCPAAHQLFEQTLQPGLSEILLGEVDLIDAIRPTTAVDGLWLIPAGEWDREVIQALARQGVADMFQRLREEFDFIVVDSHPLLPATDSLLIAQHVDAVLLSLMRDLSQAPKVHAAGQKLSSLGVRVLGAVVNGMPAEVYETASPAAAAVAR
jgi:capsular exopolysaccharide synthesis family protein